MISVIVPAYNKETALSCILRALFAQPAEFELIAVDGGSTDRTCALVSAFALSPQQCVETLLALRQNIVYS